VSSIPASESRLQVCLVLQFIQQFFRVFVADPQTVLYLTDGNTSLSPLGGKLFCHPFFDTPCGAYEYLGRVRHADGTPLGARQEDLTQFDPGVFVDEGQTGLSLFEKRTHAP
jgi:hypothetical protein